MAASEVGKAPNHRPDIFVLNFFVNLSHCSQRFDKKINDRKISSA